MVDVQENEGPNISADDLANLKPDGHQYCGNFEDRECPDIHACGGLVTWTRRGASSLVPWRNRSWTPKRYPSPRVHTRYLGRREGGSYWSGPIMRAIENLRLVWGS